MRVCIPTDDDRGNDAHVCDHFGSTPFFTIVDTESGEVEVIGNAEEQHQHGMCNPMGQLLSRSIDAVICRGLGRRALALLEQAGVEVYVAEQETVSRIIESARKGEVQRMGLDDACGGHAHCS
jgi:predicted Fe-Mo cluster-binding NifX family protein